MENYLFKKMTIVDNIWLNAKSDSSHVFHWSDGRLLTFTNWAPGNPKVNYTTEICLQMDANALVRGKWANEPCAKKNLVVCERKQGWNLEKIQSLIEKLQETNEKQQEEIERLKANPVPLGFIYVQLSNQKSPQEVWSSELKWTDISSTYDSAFFRVLGSKTAPFRKVQEEFAPYIDEIKFDECKGAHCFNANTDLNLWSVKTLHTGGWSPHVMSASLERGTGEWYKGLMQFHTAGGEIRPKNTAIKVWRRSA